MAIHSSTIAWKIPWTEEPGRLQSMGSQRVGHDWVTSQTMLAKLLGFPGGADGKASACNGKSHGWRSLIGYSPWGRKELERTERLHFHFQTMVEVMKIMVTSFKRSHACTAILSAPNPAGGQHWPTPPLETPGHSQASLVSFLWSHCSFLLGPRHKVLFVPSKSLFPSPV